MPQPTKPGAVSEHWLINCPGAQTFTVVDSVLADRYRAHSSGSFTVEGPLVLAEQIPAAVLAERERIAAQVLEMAAQVTRDSPEFSTLLSVASRIRQARP